ncbi:MAG: EsaB/YukD family protein [Synergistaceae bacterium]|jgi:hypothetical protein|nr:EsaB/YukD family protein [Synergistaceae bacterium]
MHDAYIVTVTDETGAFETDLEIPSRIPLGNWKDKVMAILKVLDGNLFQGWGGCAMAFEGRPLRDDETLAQAGVFEGSRLVVTRG